MLAGRSAQKPAPRPLPWTRATPPPRAPHHHALPVSRGHQQFSLFRGGGKRLRQAILLRKFGHAAVHAFRRPDADTLPQDRLQVFHALAESVLDAQPLLPLFQQVGVLSGRQTQAGIHRHVLRLLPFAHRIDVTLDPQFAENGQISSRVQLLRPAQRSLVVRDLRTCVSRSLSLHVSREKLEAQPHQLRLRSPFDFVHPPAFAAGLPHQLTQLLKLLLHLRNCVSSVIIAKASC